MLHLREVLLSLIYLSSRRELQSKEGGWGSHGISDGVFEIIKAAQWKEKKKRNKWKALHCFHGLRSDPTTNPT